MTQNLLNFDVCANRHRGAAESVAANPSQQSKQLARKRILEALSASNGLICQALENQLGMAHESCSARCSELLRAGEIEIVGHALTRSGKKARVYRVKES